MQCALNYYLLNITRSEVVAETKITCASFFFLKIMDIFQRSEKKKTMKIDVPAEIAHVAVDEHIHMFEIEFSPEHDWS